MSGAPGADRGRPHAAVFGAGIAGLSAAHELARLGYRVSVHELEGGLPHVLDLLAGPLAAAMALAACNRLAPRRGGARAKRSLAERIRAAV